MNAILNAWMDRVNNGDLEGVLGMYDPSATLLPTLSPQQASTPAAIRAYFENLAAKPALIVKLDHDTLTEYHLSETVTCICGQYTFSYEENAAVQIFPSRFTFVVDKTKNHPIIHHHSSQIPQPHS